MKIKYTLNKIKKYIDAVIYILSAILLFGHLPRYFDLMSNRLSWYFKDVCLTVSILLLFIFIYRNNKFEDSRIKKLFYWGLLFVSIKVSFSLFDSVISYYEIHIHKTILLLQYFPLAYIALKAYCDYRKGNDNDNSKV